MGRKVRITREMILQAAYEILDEAGIGAVLIGLIIHENLPAAANILKILLLGFVAYDTYHAITHHVGTGVNSEDDFLCHRSMKGFIFSSSPMVVFSPWPGSTMVSSGSCTNERRL